MTYRPKDKGENPQSALKHELFRRLIEAQAQKALYVPSMVGRPYLIIDMTAGDGHGVNNGRDLLGQITSLPTPLLALHAAERLAQKGSPVHVDKVERHYRVLGLL